MKAWLLPLLACTGCSGRIVEKGDALACADCGAGYPIVEGVPRFVPRENYATNFGFQWNRFRRTQLDSTSGIPISRRRFLDQSGWEPAELAGALVLDVGCGAGRFAEVAADCGARVVAVDYSDAVVACHANLGSRDNVSVLQADVFHLPLHPGTFDFVYCFGVLQHTPDPRAAFLALPPALKPGGRLAVDVYRRHWSNVLLPKYWLRPFTTRMAQQRLFAAVERWVPRLLPAAGALSRLPLLGPYLRRLMPIACYQGLLPLDPRQQHDWSVLDTFDWYGPRYDRPQTAGTLRAWCQEAGLERIEIVHPAHLAARARRPA